jgi:assimilatory nitrate reductase catalytic subunit
MGFGDGFSWRSPAQVFREWARLTAYENTGRLLNLGPMVGLAPDAYDALEPIQWPVTAAGGTPRLFTDGVFQTPDGRARMIPTPAQGPARATDAAYPLGLNTGRVRDHWHTMTRTGLAPDLCRHAPEPFVEIHPEDAEPLGVADGALTRVQTAFGEAVVEARVTDRQRRGGLFMPMHWTEGFAPSGRSNPLISPDVDPQSGQPEFKHTPARARPYRETWRGFFLARQGWTAPAGLDLIWRRIPQTGCQLHEFAGRGGPEERQALRKALAKDAPADVVRFEDSAGGSLREACLDATGRLERVLFFTIASRLPARDWLADLFTQEALSPTERTALLVGQAPGQVVDAGPLVCACLRVGARKIEAAIAAGAAGVDAVGAATGAGTNCGSCRPEIARMLAGAPRLEARHAA